MQCILCGSKNTAHFLDSRNTHGRNEIDAKAFYKMYRCFDCRSVFLGDITIDERYYRENYDVGYYDTSGGSLRDFLTDRLTKFSAHQKEKMLLGYFRGNKRKLSILDIGCGEGSFLSSLDKKTFDTYGLEINPEGADICIKKNLKVYTQNIFNVDFKGKKFDIITMWHVLEHLNNPIETAKRIGELLDKDGILAISTPNENSFGFKYGKSDWFHLDSPRHLVIYNKTSLNKLFRLSGFKIIDIRNEFYEYPLDLFWSIRNSSAKFIFLPLYPLIKIAKSETLTVICKKS